MPGPERTPDRTLLDLPSLPESELTGSSLPHLPASSPPPPWSCRVRAVLWLARARAPLPAGSPYADRSLPWTLGGVVDYLESPVGSYREVFAGPLVRGSRPWPVPTVHLPFIAVDSWPSVHGGRAHWALPKVLARFSGDVGRGSAAAYGRGWSLGVAARPVGLRVPVVAPLGSAQDGARAAVSLRGRGRLARVRVTASGPSLDGWLGNGSHPGLLVTGRLVVGAPTREEALPE